MKSTSRTIIKTALFIAVLVGVALIIWPHAASAAFDIKKGIVGNLSEECQLTGKCGWCDFIDLMGILQRVILSIFGGVALIMLIWAGQSMITAAGSQEKVSAAKKLITSTLLGVLIILIGYFLINVVIVVLINQTGTTGAKLYGKDWFTAQCLVAREADYCKGKKDGDICGESRDGATICSSGKCMINCEYVTNKNPELYTGCKADCTPDTPVEGICPTTTDKCCIKKI